MITRSLACLRFLVDSSGSMSSRVLRGSVWAFASYGLGQVLTLMRSIILARLLMPADFGLMGMASLSIAFLLVFTETGIWPAIVQRQEVDQSTLNTAWLIAVARGFLLGLVTFVAAPTIALFFASPLLGPMLRVMALPFMLDGFNSLGLVLLQKEMDFKTLAVFNLATTVVNLAFAAAAAFLLRNVWALVIGTLAGSVAALVLSYVVHPFRPQLRFDRQRARELWGFGRFLTASSIVNYALTQGDDAYVGKTLGAAPLGFYELAYRLSNLPATSISHVLSRVTLPAYSTMQHDLDQLRRTYLRVLKLTALISIPMAAGLFCLAPLLVGVLYGEKWMPAVPAFQFLCLFGLERSIGGTSSPIFLALGKPNIGLRILLVKLTVMALGIVPLTTRYGIVGTSVAVTLSAIVVQVAVVFYVARLLRVSWFRAVEPLLKPLGGSLLMTFVLLSLQNVFHWTTGAWGLLTLTVTGLLVYGGFVATTERQLIREMRAWLAPPQQAHSNP